MRNCPNKECLLNEVFVTPETCGFQLVVSFFARTHQTNAVYTAEQLHEIYNEMLHMIKRYGEEKRKTENVMRMSGMGGMVHINDLPLYFNNSNCSTMDTREPTLNRSTCTSSDDISNRATASYTPSEPTPRVVQDVKPVIQNTFGTPLNEPDIVHSRNSEPLPDDSPYLNISFREIFEKTRFIGLNKVEHLDRLSRCVSKPLGCCYDEVRDVWAIADSNNNRVVLYPEGITIESPKFQNPGTVCVLEAGKRLGILTDYCLATYAYDDHNVSIIFEDTSELKCRGLARTPLGNLATIHKEGYKRNVIVFDMGRSKNFGKRLAEIEIADDGGANPSFCAMNGNRLVVTDLGRQTLTLLTFAPDEKTATIKRTIPRKWDKQGEPHGSFDFVSGVQMDREGWILVADAGGHTIQLFDQNLDYVTRVGTSFLLPYMSSVCINNEGKVLICGRHDNHISISELVSFDTLPPIGKVTSGGMSRGGANGSFTNVRGRGSCRGGGRITRGSSPFNHRFTSGGFT